MKISRLPVGQMESNCYIVWDEKTHGALIIDPGDEAEFITQKIIENELAPVAIAATHGHFDHVMAALTLQLAFGIPFYINKEDEFLVQRMRYSAKYFLKTDPGPQPETVPLGKEFKVTNLEFKIIPVSGHTPGSVCFYNKKEKALFSGDLIFADGYIGRTDFSYSDKNDLKNSIVKVMELPKDTVVYPGHGTEFELGDFEYM